MPSIDFKNHALQRNFQSLASMAGPGPGQNKPILVTIPADEKFLSRSDTPPNSAESQENLDYYLKKSGKNEVKFGCEP